MSDKQMSNELMRRNDGDDRVIKGQLLTFDANAGRWMLDGNSPPPDLKLLVAGTVSVAQLWKGGKPLTTLWPNDVPSLASAVEEGNDRVPKEEWEEGVDGKPKPPWAISRVVYLVDPNTAKKYTTAASTTGQKIACELLTDQIETMCRLRGAEVYAVVELGIGSFRTKFGTRKPRPDYNVVSWRCIGSDATPALPARDVLPPLLGELMGDEVGF
jgi:hypothetical protein